eukprot:9195096-Pyramimonas_sp.AAC.1
MWPKCMGVSGESTALGGNKYKDWRLRRCGWAVVNLGAHGLFEGVASGTLPTKVQSAGRAELFALIELAKRSTGVIRVYCDNMSVVKRKSASLDLWAQFHDVMTARADRL